MRDRAVEVCTCVCACVSGAAAISPPASDRQLAILARFGLPSVAMHSFFPTNVCAESDGQPSNQRHRRHGKMAVPRGYRADRGVGLTLQVGCLSQRLHRGEAVTAEKHDGDRHDVTWAAVVT